MGGLAPGRGEHQRHQRQCAQQQRAGEERRVPAVVGRDPDEKRAAHEAGAAVGADPHRVRHSQLAAVGGLDGVRVDGDVLCRRERHVEKQEGAELPGVPRRIGAGEHRGRHGEQAEADPDPEPPAAEPVHQRRPEKLEDPGQRGARREPDAGQAHA